MIKLKRIIFIISVIVSAILFAGCSKKMHPGQRNNSERTSVEKNTITKTSKATFPKVITVNDNAASKSLDGRLYYDVMGHRYWKNYKNGKYYLFNKSMYSNPDFKKR